MEPVTHILTGACLARTGFDRRAAYATLAMAVAAEFPDIDTLWSLRGPVAGFQHHRGITHTFLGIPFEAALIVVGVYGLHRWRAARARRAIGKSRPSLPEATPVVPIRERPLTAAPVRWGMLYAFILLALLSHLWLDYTNNYGLRPFFPFNPRWYAASITFIFDPLMFALLLGAVVLPPLFRLIGSEVGARKQPFAARGWAVAALLGCCGLWAWRAVEHARAVDLALAQTYTQPLLSQEADPPSVPGQAETPLPPAPPSLQLPARRALASPDPISPFRWYSVADYGPLYQPATIDLRVGTVTTTFPTQKLNATPELLAAFASPLGRAYLDWSPMPFLTQTPDHSVQFQDPRFMGDMPWLHLNSSRAPLTGVVRLDAQNHVVGETMNGKAQR